MGMIVMTYDDSHSKKRKPKKKIIEHLPTSTITIHAYEQTPLQWIRWLRSSSLKNGTAVVCRQAHSDRGHTWTQYNGILKHHHEHYHASAYGAVRHHPVVPAANSSP
ncbi:unnamed protein product [Lactuca virosa]|uniref:Uncharacterized protein n=1 Tax=Lactuca virosa TaxID=75947 RepID=A0AAU9LX62_9ASTR|nr:unnamed protein product [Lactuca virosa]